MTEREMRSSLFLFGSLNYPATSCITCCLNHLGKLISMPGTHLEEDIILSAFALEPMKSHISARSFVLLALLAPRLMPRLTAKDTAFLIEAASSKPSKLGRCPCQPHSGLQPWPCRSRAPKPTGKGDTAPDKWQQTLGNLLQQMAKEIQR